MVSDDMDFQFQAFCVLTRLYFQQMNVSEQHNCISGEIPNIVELISVHYVNH